MIDRITSLIDLYDQELKSLELHRYKKNAVLLKKDWPNDDWITDTMELLFYYKEIEKLKSKIEVLNELLI